MIYGTCPSCGSTHTIKLPYGGLVHVFECRDCGIMFRIRDEPLPIEKAWPDNRYRMKGPSIEDYADDLTFGDLDRRMRERWGDEPEVDDALHYYVNGLFPDTGFRFRTIPAEIVRTRNSRRRSNGRPSPRRGMAMTQKRGRK